MPYGREEFFAVLAAWNAAAWPYWMLAYAAGIGVIALCFRGTGRASRLALALLGVMWIVIAIGYHWLHLAQINLAAPAFALGFVLEGGLLIAFAITTDVRMSVCCDARTVLALSIMIYGLIGYPLASWAFGDSYPAAAVFGISPGPTVIFTLGALLLARAQGSQTLMMAPLLWAAAGGSTALLLGVPQDLGIIIAALIAAIFMLPFGAKAHHGDGAGVARR